MSPTIRRKKPSTVYVVALFNRDLDGFGGWRPTPGSTAALVSSPINQVDRPG